MKKLINFARAAAMTMLLVLMLTAARTAWAQSWTAYVSDVVVVGGGGNWVTNSTVLDYINTHGYTLCELDLNASAVGGEAVYLLYKTADRNHPDGGYVADFRIRVGYQYYISDDPITIDGVTYDKVPYVDVANNGFKGDLNYQTDDHEDNYIILYYRKTTHNDYTAVSKITIDTDGSNALDGRDLNQGAGGEYIYMHVTRDYLTNRPKTDPTFTADFVYDGYPHNVVSSYGEKIDKNDQFWFRINGVLTRKPENDKVTNAGTYPIEFSVHGNSNSYLYDSPIQQRTLTISKAQNTVTQAPTAKTLYAIGKELELVNAGSAKFGNLEYRLGTTGEYSTSLPKATASGTYNVYYRAEGSSNYDASEAQSMTVTIQEIPLSKDKNDNYLINNKADFDNFATMVNNGYDFNGETVILENDITDKDKISSIVGTVNPSSHPFSGTFDGNGHYITVYISDYTTEGTAPFRLISGATIKNLVVKGSVYGNKYHTSGLVGFAGENSTGNRIENCVVSTSIYGVSYVGGILGHGKSSNITIEGCVFNGFIADAMNIGVFFGWGDDGGTKTIKNCLYKKVSNQTETNLDFTKHSAGSETVNNCHKFTDLHTLTLVEGVTATFPTLDQTYDVSKITTYADGGMVYDGKISENLDITLSTDKKGYTVQCTYNGTTAQGSVQGKLNLRMPAADVTTTVVPLGYEFILPECFEITNDVEYIDDDHIYVAKDVDEIKFARKFGYKETTETPSVYIVNGTSLYRDIYGYYTVTVDKDMEIEAEAEGFEQTDDNYTIATVADLIAFSKAVNNGNNCNGKTITVVADIDFPNEDNNFTSIGWWDRNNDIDYYFDGTFDGGGHKISGIRMSNENKSFQGLFGQISINGIVKNVILADANITGYNCVGGIVGYSVGTITDCKVVNAVINAHSVSAIAGNNVGTLIDNYYYNCNVKGCNGEDIDGALPVYKLTLDEGITTTTEPAFTYGKDNDRYYKSGISLSFTCPEGSTLLANGNIIDDAASYEMPAEDVKIKAIKVVEVSYIDTDGKEQTVNAIPLDGSELELVSGWYVVNSDITFTETIELKGDVNLILADGYTMTVDLQTYDMSNKMGIYGDINVNPTFSIFGQETQSGKLEIINCENGIYNYGNTYLNGGTIQINVDGNYSMAIYSDQIQINNGDINLESDQRGISADKCTITGGRLSIDAPSASSNAQCYGIYSSSVIIGLSSKEDRVMCSSFWMSVQSRPHEYSDITVSEGQILTDGVNLYYGHLTSEQVQALDKQPLYRINSLQLPECMELVKYQEQGDGMDKFYFVLKFGYQLTSPVTMDNQPVTADENGIYSVAISKDSEVKAEWTTTSLSDTYQIATVADLYAFAVAVNGGNTFAGKTITVVNDINFKPSDDETNNFTTIGWYDMRGVGIYFEGTFDGNSKTISGLRINRPNNDCQGLFGMCADNAVIKDVILDDVNIIDHECVGGIVGYNRGEITGCKVLNGSFVSQSRNDFGAIVGYNVGTLSNNYYYNCSVNGATTNVGCNRDDIDGALPVYKLTLGEGITTTTDPAFTYPEGIYYFEAGVTLEFSGGTEGYYANGEKINGNTYEMPENDVIISTPITVEVPYIDADGKEKTATAKPLYGFETELPEGWYVVNSDITFDHEITLTGNVNLILADGKTMTVTPGTGNVGIRCDRNSFTAFGQSGQSGKLEIKDCYLGIYNCDIITLNGGVIQIKSQNEAVCIEQIIINGGKVDMESVLQTAVSYSSCTIITGGNINIKTFNGSTSAGIYCSNIILGLARQEDQIAVTRYWLSGSPDDECSNITIAEGQTLTDGKNLYSGTYTGEDVKVFDGKTLRRAFALTLPECMEVVSTSIQDGGKVKFDFAVKFGYKLKSAVTRDGYKIEPTDGIYTITISADSEIKADFTSTDNYEIATVGDLIAFSNAVNKGNGFSDKTVTVIADIDFKPAENEVNNFTAIGGRWDGAKGIYYDFNGTFDGGGHKIIGIRITGGDKNQGLFSGVGTTGIVQNVVICDANINSNEDYWAGGIAGFSEGTISNCKVVNAVINANSDVGAIAGENFGSLENNYYYYCTVNGKTTGVGCDGKDIEPNDGAMPALIIDGDSDQSLTIIPGTYSKAFYLRNITADIPTTIMLPFNFEASDFGVEKFYTFTGFNADTWTATMTTDNEATTLEANIPYIFKPTHNVTMVTFDKKVTVTTEGDKKTEIDGWAFQGTYDYTSWNTEGERTITNVYGFAATSGTNQEKGKIDAGDFVRAGLNTRIRPTRAYLEYTGNDKTLQKSALDLPERIKVVFIDKETSSVIDDPTINPSDPDSDIPTPTSEIQPVLDNVKVWSYDKTIFIQSRPGTDYRIIDATGRLLKEATTQSDRDEVRLGSRSGIVIVIIGGKAYKLSN